MRTSLVRGTTLALLFVGLAVVGLAMWFIGANMPESDSAPVIASRMNSRPLALVGAVTLILAMLALIALARWISRRASGARFPAIGTTILTLGAVFHLIENVLVLVLFSGDIAGGQALWTAIRMLQFGAFTLIGLGSGVLAIGMRPVWVGVLGLIVGVLGFADGLNGLAGVLGAAALDLSVAPPFNILLLAWLIVLGVRGDRTRATAQDPASRVLAGS